jgi:hypothetical protein
LYCLSFFALRLLVTSLVSSNVFYDKNKKRFEYVSFLLNHWWAKESADFEIEVSRFSDGTFWKLWGEEGEGRGGLSMYIHLWHIHSF